MEEEKKQLARQSIARVLDERKEILFAHVFGSFVHDPGFPDLDVGVYLREDAWSSTSPKETFDCETALGIALERKLGYPVNVKVLNRAPLAPSHAVTNGRVLLSRGETKRLDWVKGTWYRCVDMRHFFRSSLFDLPGTE